MRWSIKKFNERRLLEETREEADEFDGVAKRIEEEGKEGKMRLRDAIESVADKQRKAIAEWEAQNPGWEESEKGKDEYLKIVRSVMADVSQETEENRIIKNIAKETIIDR